MQCADNSIPIYCYIDLIQRFIGLTYFAYRTARRIYTLLSSHLNVNEIYGMDKSDDKCDPLVDIGAPLYQCDQATNFFLFLDVFWILLGAPNNVSFAKLRCTFMRGSSNEQWCCVTERFFDLIPFLTKLIPILFNATWTWIDLFFSGIGEYYYNS